MFRVRPKVSYDILYDVSIVSPLCDQTGSTIASASTTIHYSTSIALYYRGLKILIDNTSHCIRSFNKL